MIGFIITLIFLALLVLPFAYLYFTRYYVKVQHSVGRDAVDVKIGKRFFMKWPKQANELTGRYSRLLDYDYRFVYASVSVSDLDAANEAAQKTAEAKAIVRKWKNKKKPRAVIRAAKKAK